jgi:hypothetical protein
MSKKTLRRDLAFAKANPLNTIKLRKPISGRQRKISMETRRRMKEKLQENPTLTVVKLRRIIPALANRSIQVTKNCCVRNLQLPSRKKANKSLLTYQMKEQRLAFSAEHVN